MSSLKAKKCPECGERFYRRSKDCCPNPACGIELVILRSGRVITRREHGNKVKVFDHFLQKYMAPRRVFFGSKGSSVYVTQLKFAGQLVADASKFLGYNSRFDIDPTDFAIMCMDRLFQEQSWAAYTVRIDTLRMCNGKALWSMAPKVLRALESDESSIRTQNMHAANVNNQIQVPVLG